MPKVWDPLSNGARMRETEQMAIFQQPAKVFLSRKSVDI